jgi:hypothetical protein
MQDPVLTGFKENVKQLLSQSLVSTLLHITTAGIYVIRNGHGNSKSKTRPV